MKRLRLQVNGIVQGVGFRPFLHRLARRFALAGWVRNTAAGVEGELEGQAVGPPPVVLGPGPPGRGGCPRAGPPGAGGPAPRGGGALTPRGGPRGAPLANLW